jgi:superfamily II DNA or RNA helicase
LHTPLQTGTLVVVRGRPWLLRAQIPRPDCREIHLDAAAGHRAAPPGGPLVLLAPFDRPIPISQQSAPRPLSRRAWMAALRGAVLAQREQGNLCAAAGARIDLWPHQLEPALAVVRHGARRLLLADAVGLGKTIEAGLVLAELRARSALDRALVLAPPGLCDQWRAELSDRFGLDSTVSDAAWLRGLRPVLPAGLNPWSVPGIRVASIDFAKRPEVRRGLERVCWDAVVVDEAHLAAGDSERRSAAHALASRARLVLLLTATPHSGDARTFHALCGIGALTARDPIVAVRRSRQEAGISGRRRVHLSRVRPDAAEAAVRRQLDAYIGRVWARRTGADGREARLAMIVLLKRSFSGMGPLRRSLATRRERLGPSPRLEETQLPLLWDEDDRADAAPDAVLGAPGLDDRHEERHALRLLEESAALAEAHDSKRRALARVLARVREPAIVFTEYRDTLEAVRASVGIDAVVLHGGLDRFERAEAVGRFNGGSARVLLATDAAGEGLNLQARCRLVINLELPWNPMRLEQRIGRVDRIGQRRTVHAVNLIAAGTAEAGVLARLAQRLHRARSGIGKVEDVLGLAEERLMDACLGLDDDGTSAGSIAAADPTAGSRVLQRLDLASEARRAVGNIEQRRRLLDASRARPRRPVESRLLRCSGRIAVTAVRRSRAPIAGGGTGLLAVFRVGSGVPAEPGAFEELVPVFAECACPRMSRRGQVRDHAAAALATLVPQMARSIPAGQMQARPDGAGFDRDARAGALARTRQTVQRGLFDRRAERGADEEEAGGRLDTADTADGALTQEPRPALLLFVTS